MPNNSPSNRYETRGSVERTAAVGASIEATLKRGEGTRDEDRVKFKGKGESAEEAMEEFETMLEQYESEYAERLRNIQPSDNDVV